MTRKNTIPDRWLNYKTISERIVGTPFVAFKVPLGEKYFRKLNVEDRFTIDDVIDNTPGLGLVIDLTNTDKYYRSVALQAKGIEYRKLSVPGKRVPPANLVSCFCDIVHDFLSSSSTNNQDTIIGVHCTHGVNRTGYMICSFMIQHLMKQPSEAIQLFEAARGHKIERGEYVRALKRLYSDEQYKTQHKQTASPRGVLPANSHAFRAGKSEVQGNKRRCLPPDAPSSAKRMREYITPNFWRKPSLITDCPVPEYRNLNPNAAEPQAGPSWRSAPDNSQEQQLEEGDVGGFRKKMKKDNSQRYPSTCGMERGGARYHVSRASHKGCPANPESAHLQRSPDVSPNRQLETREKPAYEVPNWRRWQQQRFTSPPQPLPQPLPHPSPQFPSSHPSSAERWFGHGVERERGPGAGSAMSRGGGGDGRGWSRGRGDRQPRGRWGRWVARQV